MVQGSRELREDGELSNTAKDYFTRSWNSCSIRDDPSVGPREELKLVSAGGSHASRTYNSQLYSYNSYLQVPKRRDLKNGREGAAYA